MRRLAGPLFFVAVLAAGLLLSEAVARSRTPGFRPVGRERDQFYCYDSRLGWVGLPGASGLFAGPEGEVEVSINSDGLRERELVLPLPGTVILVLGDSYVWGYGVEQQDRFTETLAGLMPDCSIINAGVSGYGTDQEYLLLRDLLPIYQPDVVVLVMAPDDMRNNCYSMQHFYRKPVYKMTDYGLQLVGVPVLQEGWFFRLQRKILTGTCLGQRYWQRAAPGPKKYAPSLTRKLVQAIAVYCSQNRAEFLCVLPAGCDELAAVVEVAAQFGGFSTVRLQPVLGISAEYKLDGDEHWNWQGHNLVASVLWGALETMIGGA